MQQTVEALVDLSRDSLDMISLALTEQLDKLAKVRRILCCLRCYLSVSQQIESAGFRGIDILQVNMVVNYDLPLLNERDPSGNKGDLRPDIETYIHRIGT